MSRRYFGALFLAWFAMSFVVGLRATAQRTDDNAVVAANDAFGVTVGFQSVGLYGPTNVRGFNPAQAENLRIEGLYYDQQLTYSNPFLFSRSDIQVGLAAQSYSFPSSTGIVDYKLRTPGDEALISVLLTRGPLNMATAAIDAELPVNNYISIGGSVVDYNNFDYNNARRSKSLGYSLLLRIRPTEYAEIEPFIASTHNREHQELPNIHANGVDQLPMYNAQQLPAQDWTSWGWNQLTAGIIAKTDAGPLWHITTGVFRSLAQNSQNFNDLLLGPSAQGIANRIIDITPPGEPDHIPATFDSLGASFTMFTSENWSLTCAAAVSGEVTEVTRFSILAYCLFTDKQTQRRQTSIFPRQAATT